MSDQAKSITSSPQPLEKSGAPQAKPLSSLAPASTVQEELIKSEERCASINRIGQFLLAFGCGSMVITGGAIGIIAVFAAALLATPVGWGIIGGVGGVALLTGIIGVALVASHSREKLWDILGSALGGSIIGLSVVILAWIIAGYCVIAPMILRIPLMGAADMAYWGGGIYGIMFIILLSPLAIPVGVGVGGMYMIPMIRQKIQPPRRYHFDILPIKPESNDETLKQAFATNLQALQPQGKEFIQPSSKETQHSAVVELIQNGHFREAYCHLLKLHKDESDKYKKIEYALELNYLTHRIGASLISKKTFAKYINTTTSILLAEMKDSKADPRLFWHLRHLLPFSDAMENLISIAYHYNKEDFRQKIPWRLLENS